MKNQEFEADPYVPHNPLDVDENTLDEEKNQDWKQRKALRQSWKTRQPYKDIDFNINSIMRDYILSEGVEEDFTVPLEEAPSKVLDVETIPRQFRNNQKVIVEGQFTPITPNKAKITEAIAELAKLHQKTSELEFIPENHFVSLVVSFREPVEFAHTYQIDIPHTVHSDPTVCVVVPTSKKKMWKAKHPEGVKIFKLGKFFKRFKVWGNQRKLANSYDHFFFDKNGIDKDTMDRFLGNDFRRLNKLPTPTDVISWEQDKKRALNSAFVQLEVAMLTTSARIARIEMSQEDIVDNVMTFLKNFTTCFDSKNLKRIYIKSSKSPSLLIHQEEKGFKRSLEFAAEKKFKKVKGEQPRKESKKTENVAPIKESKAKVTEIPVVAIKKPEPSKKVDVPTKKIVKKK